MMTMTRPRRRPPPPRPDGLAACLPDAALDATWHGLQARRFASLQAAFARHGGCAPADHVCGLLRTHWDQPLSRVARWITQRDIVSLAWQAQVWIPLFQFERPSLDLDATTCGLVRTLRPVYDDWELAEWFVRPHEFLAGRIPVGLLAGNPRAVKEAARMDLFINRW
jgi:hypothetical protein